MAGDHVRQSGFRVLGYWGFKSRKIRYVGRDILEDREVHLGGRQRVPQGGNRQRSCGVGVGLVRGAEDSHRQVRAETQREGHIAAGLLSSDQSERLFLLYSVGHSSYP